MTRGPQSWQSVPIGQADHSEPGPPSSQSPSPTHVHFWAESEQKKIDPGTWGGAPGDGASGGDGGGDGTCTCRGSQSVQSSPYEHELYSAPGPPSSQSPSEANQHASSHKSSGGGGLGTAPGLCGGAGGCGGWT